MSLRSLSAVFVILATVVLACGQPEATPAPTETPVPALVQAPTTGPTETAVTPTAKATATATERQPTPTSATVPTATEEATVSGSRTRPEVPALEPIPNPPERDLYELGLRLRPASGKAVPRIVNPEPVSYDAGHKTEFWVVDLDNDTVYTVEATLKHVSVHAYWYVDDSLVLSEEDIRRAAEVFEAEIHPIVTGYFGDIWNPGVDNDPRLTILHTPLEGVAGYYGSADEYPAETHPYSNEREMIYMDGGGLIPGTQDYLGVLAHEFQHAVQWNLDGSEDAWVTEGLAEVARELVGYQADSVRAFLRNPHTQLNYWPDDLGSSYYSYGASTLFLTYVIEHYGGREGLRLLAQEPADGANGLNAYLSEYGKSFTEVFKDWVIANYLDEPQGLYGYPDRDVAVATVLVMPEYGERNEVLPQFGTHYVKLLTLQGDIFIDFQGQAKAARVGTECRGGERCWWGNRGDLIDSTLTGELDLTGLSTATLEFWTWFQVEEGWDYAYVEVSADGGKSWTILKGLHTTAQNPVGNSYGHGFTGRSNGWVSESIDLSPYVGGEVLLRFEYITDETTYLDGFLIDDITVPELGFLDDAEEDRGWDANGFARIDNVLPQEYLVQVIVETADGVTAVSDLALDEDRRGRMFVEGLGTEVKSVVVAISPVTPGTHQPAQYTLRVGPSE